MKTILLLILGGFILHDASAQAYVPVDYEQKKEYIEFEIDYYLVDQKDIASLNDKDKTRLKEMRTEKFVEHFINDENELTSIIRINDHQHAFADWMEGPEVIVIDKNGLMNYDKNGQKVRGVAHTPVYLDMLGDFQNDLSLDISFPDQQDLDQLHAMGFEIEDLGNGFIEIKRGQRSVIFNPDENFVQENLFHSNGDPLRQMQKHYMQLPNGEMTLERSKEITHLRLSSGVHAQHIILKLFSDQHLEQVYNRETLREEDRLKVIMNADQSLLKAGSEAFDQTLITAYIYNMNGRLVKEEQLQNGGDRWMNINDLPSGIYILKMSAEGKSLSSKFVKP